MNTKVPFSVKKMSKRPAPPVSPERGDSHKRASAVVSPQPPPPAKVQHVEISDDSVQSVAESEAESESWESSDSIRGLIDDEASEGSESEEDGSGDILYNEQEREHYAEKYRVREVKPTEEWLGRLQGKNQEEVNEYFEQRMKGRAKKEEEGSLLTSNRQSLQIKMEEDWNLYWVGCREGKEHVVVMSMLNKTAFYHEYRDPNSKVRVGSVFHLKHKYPGTVFVEAAREADVKFSFTSIDHVFFKRIHKLQPEGLEQLFRKKQKVRKEFKRKQLVRVTRGVYAGDLAMVLGVRKSGVSALVVPRINIEDIQLRMRMVDEKYHDEPEVAKDRKNSLLKQHFSPATVFSSKIRPRQELITADKFEVFKDLPFNRKIMVTQDGLIQLYFPNNAFSLPKGTLTPDEVTPFANEDLIKQARLFQNDINLEKGDEVTVLGGELKGARALVHAVEGRMVTLRCGRKADKMVEERMENLCKKFHDGQRVSVVSGSHKGKSGLVINQKDSIVTIWTDNEHTITVNCSNLVRYRADRDVHNTLGIRKDQLIKTTQGILGVVLEVKKDSVDILDTHNEIQTVNNLDYDYSIDYFRLAAQDLYGGVLKPRCLVRITQGPHQGEQAEVKCAYQSHTFLHFSEKPEHRCLLAVPVRDCTLISGKPEKPRFRTLEEQNQSISQHFQIGRSLILRKGHFKGYRAYIEKVTVEQLKVKIPQKKHTEWLMRADYELGQEVTVDQRERNEVSVHSVCERSIYV